MICESMNVNEKNSWFAQPLEFYGDLGLLGILAIGVIKGRLRLIERQSRMNWEFPVAPPTTNKLALLPILIQHHEITMKTKRHDSKLELWKTKNLSNA